MSTFDILNNINVNDHTEKKNGLTYLSWAWAWAETMKKFPDASYEIERFENNLPYQYDDGIGFMVWTKVTIEGVTREMWLPVMDANNNAMKKEEYTVKTKRGDIPVKPATMFDVNKTIMRCLVKNLAMFGLGLYIYSGEDLPEEEQADAEREKLIAMFKTRYTEQSIAKMEESKGSVDGWSNEDLQKAIKFADMKNKKQMNINSQEETF